MIDILKEYLVSLGFEVDEKKYKNATKKLKDYETTAAKVAENVGKNMTKGAAVAVTALASITAGVMTYMESVARADIETEKFARRMWMTETNARSLQNSLKAMGESMDTIYDVAANPELRNRFLRLRADAAKLEGGPEIEQGLKEIRDFYFEFQRLKLLINYAGRYIAYYLSKYLAEPMARIKAALKSINDNGRNIAQEWGEKIAKGLSWIIRLFAAGAQGVGDLISMIHRLPGEMKLALLAIAALGFAAMNPFTLMIAAIGAVLLLLDDFYTWKRGGKSLLGDTWSELSNLDFGSKSFESIKELLSSVGELFGTLGQKWKKLNETVKEKTGLTILGNALEGIDFIVSSIVNGLTDIIDLINSIIKGDPPDWLVDAMFAMNGTTKAKVEKQLADYDENQAKKQEKKENPVSFNPFAWMQQINSLDPEKQFTLPVFAGPLAPTEQMKQIISNDNRKDVKQENKMEVNNTFAVTGTDANAIALSIAGQMEQMIMNQFSGGWFNKAVKIPE